MKKPLSLFILFAGILISIVGCRKSNNNSTNNSGPLLSELVDLDATLSAPDDTSFVEKFSYDNSERVTESLQLEYNLPGVDTIEKDTYYYNGSDTLPYKTLHYENSPDSALLPFDVAYNYESGNINGTSTIYYFYLSGKLIEDSAIGYNYTQTNTYSYVGNSVIRNQSSTTNGTANSVYVDTFYQTSQNGNLINQIDTLYRAPSFDNITEGFAYQLDDHPNPLYNRSITPFAVLEIDGLNADPEQKNNFTSINSYSASPNDSTSEIDSYVYTYNSNGYPKSALGYDDDNNTGGSILSDTLIYVYK